MITNQESLPNKYYGSDSTNFLNDFEKLIKEIYKKQINNEKVNDKHSYYNKQNYTNIVKK